MSCFWESLLKAEQGCDAGPPSDYDFESDLTTGSSGLAIRGYAWIAESPNLIQAALDAEGYAIITSAVGAVIDSPPCILIYTTSGGEPVLQKYGHLEADYTGLVMYEVEMSFYDASDVLLGSAVGTILDSPGF